MLQSSFYVLIDFNNVSDQAFVIDDFYVSYSYVNKYIKSFKILW